MVLKSFSLLIPTLLLLICDHNETANILGLFPVPSKSHHILASKLLKTLAEKGHNVTMVSPYPSEEKIPNFTDIPIMELEGNVKQIMRTNNEELSWLDYIRFSIKGPPEIAEVVLENPKVRALEKQHFHLVIQTRLFSDPLLGIAYRLNAPVIYLSEIDAVHHLNTLTGNPASLSYVPTASLFEGFPNTLTTQMTFLQRVTNTMSYLFHQVVGSPFMNQNSQSVLSHYFPEAPPLCDLVKNISLVLLNTHYSMKSPRPYLPNVIPIGGFHIEPPKKLRPDLKQYLDDARNGAALFSFGPSVKIEDMGVEKFRHIVYMLGQLPYRVLIDSELEIPQDLLPKNIKFEKSLRQTDVLAHPNIELFICDGDLLSTTEAVYHGVPILGIPFFVDQQINIASAVSNGYAVALNEQDITAETVRVAFAEFLFDSIYRNNIKKKSALLRNQAVHPLDLALYWVEHVIRHKGAKHLQNDGTKLRLAQYLLVDVFESIVLGLLGLGVFIYLLWRALFKGKSTSRTSGSTRRKNKEKQL